MSDIRDTLAQLDRRLSDLKREIASIGDEGHGSAAGPAHNRAAAHDASLAGARMGEPDVPSSVPAFVPPPLPRVPEPHARAAEPAAVAAAPGSPGPQTPDHSSPRPFAAEAAPRPPVPPPGAAPDASAPHEVVAKAEAEAARLLAHAHERVDDLKSQIEQLLGVRQRLLGSAKDLIRQYEEEVAQLELSYPVSSAEAEIGSSPRAHAPAAHEAPRVAAHEPPTHSAFEAAPPEPPARPALFDGVVTITVPWISRIQTIQVLEDSLFRVRGAHKAYVRGYHQGEVRFELELGEAVDLIGELNRVLPYAFAIESASQDEIVIRLERGESSGGAGVQ